MHCECMLKVHVGGAYASMYVDPINHLPAYVALMCICVGFIYIYIYKHIYVYIYVYIYMCVCVSALHAL